MRFGLTISSILRRRARSVPGCACALLVVLAATPPAGAQDRLVRVIRPPEGTRTLPLRALAQDGDGFLWLGGLGGIYRYDGVEIRPWLSAGAAEGEELAVDGAGVVHARLEGGDVVRVSATGVEPVAGPHGRPLRGVLSICFDREGRLWAVDGDGLLERAAGGWRRHRPASFGGNEVRSVMAGARSGVLVVTGEAIWRLAPPAAPAHVLNHRVFDDSTRIAVLEEADGDLVILPRCCGLYRHEDGTLRQMYRRVEEALSLVRRGDTTWAAFGRHLVALGPEDRVEVLGIDQGLVSGGPLLVDREDSLWLGTFQGLVQLPEPDSLRWDARHGLVSGHARYVDRVGDSIWVATWQGTDEVRPEPSGWRLRPAPDEVGVPRSDVCPDGRGGVLLSGVRGIATHRDGETVRLWNGDARILRCKPAADGATWLATLAGVFFVPPGGDWPGELTGPLAGPGGAVPEVVMEDRRGRVWAAAGEKICRARRRPVLQGRATWVCAGIAGAYRVEDLAETGDGTVWAATFRSGVLEHEDGRWRPLPGNRELPFTELSSLVSSPRGGVWILGQSVARRVVRDPVSPAGWTEVERLGAWQGLAPGYGFDLVEDADGALWVVHQEGLTYVPPSARQGRPLAPAVRTVDLRVDGPQRWDGESLELLHRQNRIELRFAALSFRDPSRLRFQVRLARDEEWTDAGGDGRFRWVDLAPGAYEVAVRASLDGHHWTPEPAALSFRVLPPWYRRWWALMGGVVLAVAAATLAYRARVNHLLVLERQRTRIAMDLHDELGSGLASIGLLSGLLARRPGDGAGRTDTARENTRTALENARTAGESAGTARENADTAREIAATAHELGGALSDIVWSLDATAGSLEGLAGRLAERGRRLVAGSGAELETRFPDAWPPRRLVARVRRNVLLIGLEALNNAARHAAPSRVVLSLEEAGGAWSLKVIDDGCGFDPDGVDGGRGLRIMARRAAEIGAELRCDASPGEGTRVELTFQPYSGRRWHRMKIRLRRSWGSWEG